MKGWLKPTHSDATEEEKDKADNGLKVETFSEIAQVLPREATLHPVEQIVLQSESVCPAPYSLYWMYIFLHTTALFKLGAVANGFKLLH